MPAYYDDQGNLVDPTDEDRAANIADLKDSYEPKTQPMLLWPNRAQMDEEQRSATQAYSNELAQPTQTAFGGGYQSITNPAAGVVNSDFQGTSLGHEGANVAADPRNPQNPYASRGEGVAPQPVRLDDVSQARLDQINAEKRSAFAGADEEAYKGQLQQDVESRKADVAEQHARNMTALDADYIAKRDQARRDASVETAAWVAKQKQLVAQEPNRTRYWENSSGFSKAMWLIGVFGTAVANSNHPGTANQALQMLEHELDSDVQIQKDRINRQVQEGELEGRLMEKGQATRITDNEDDYSKTITRYATIKDAMMQRASVYPPGSAQAAAYMHANTVFQGKMADIAGKREAETYNSKERAITQANETARSNAKIQSEEKMKLLEIQSRYDLANIEAKTKAGERADARAAKAAEDTRTVPTSTGWSVVGPQERGSITRFLATGAGAAPNVGRVAVHKDSYEKAGEAMSGYTTAYNSMVRLHDAMNDATTAEYYMNSDAALTGAIREVGAAYAKVLNGGRGPLNEGDQKRGEEVAFGVDADSFLAKLKGANKEERLKMIQERVNRLPKEAENAISTQYGDMLKPGERIHFAPPDTNVQPQAKTTEEQETIPGSPAQGVPAPTNRQEYEKLKKADAQLGGGVLPKLPDKIGIIVKDATADISGGDREHIDKVREGALKALAAYKDSNPKATADAQVRIEAESAIAQEKTKDLDSAIIKRIQSDLVKSRTGFTNSHMREYEPADIKQMMDDSGINNVSRERILKTLELANKVVDAFNKATE